MCPGNNESASKHHSGRTRKGDPWLRGVLGEVAASAGRSKTTYLGNRYRRLADRRGKKRALVAVRRTGNPARRKAKRLGQLQALGFRVSLEPALRGEA